MKYTKDELKENYENLINAVIVKAVEDYKTALIGIKKIEDSSLSKDKKKRLEEKVKVYENDIFNLEKFFKESPWLDQVQIDRVWLLNKIKEDIQDAV